VTDETQPGVRIDAELWAEFREEVRQRRGIVRGHLKPELEAALREYIEGGQPTGDQINARLQRIEDAVGAAPTDGGAHLRSDPGETHTDSDERASPAEKPARKAGRSEKLCYLTDRIREDVVGGADNEIAEIPEAKLAAVVDEEYGFADDTAAEYVADLIERLGLVEHPVADPLLCTPERREELVEQSASDRLEEL
jgi:hypothetical protein